MARQPRQRTALPPLPAHHILSCGAGGRVEGRKLADRAGELPRRGLAVPEQAQFLDLEAGLLVQLSVGGRQRILTRINVATGQAPTVWVHLGVAVTELQQQPAQRINQDHTRDSHIHSLHHARSLAPVRRPRRQRRWRHRPTDRGRPRLVHKPVFEHDTRLEEARMTAYVYLLAPTTTVTARIAPRSAGPLPSSP